MAETRPMTKGEFRVGISFNPSSNPLVDEIKRKAAELIDLIETIELHAVSNAHETMREQERARLKALAQTAIEDGAMWAVKAATKA